MGSAGADGDDDEERHEDVVDYPPDRPLVEWLKGFARTAQLVIFLLLVVSPLVAGFLVPLGPPAYHVEVAAVNPSEAVSPDEVRQFEDLDPASATVFEAVLNDGDNAIDYRPDADSTADPVETILTRPIDAFRGGPDRLDDYPPGERPWILDGETVTVVFEGLAFRITVENRGPPLRFPAIVLGVILSALAAIPGYYLTEWDPF